MAKQTTNYFCENCGYKSLKWLGQCPSCKSWNTLVEEQVYEVETKFSKNILIKESISKSLADVDSQDDKRITTKFKELDNVLGGGLLPGQVVLLSGQPGIGKSTLLMQLSINISDTQKILYVSGEESLSQLKVRADRFTKKLPDNFFVLNTANIANINKEVEKIDPEILIVDSIQTVFDPEGTGVPGSMSQVRLCSTALTMMAKERNLPLILVGHINKEGDVAGPKVLEHVVDTVLIFEGEPLTGYRVLRSLKNRFGQVGEIGIFVMGDRGLRDIDPASNIFTSDESGGESIGIARTVVMEGNRPVLVEVQALVSHTIFPYPKRVSEGISVNRLQTICAIVSNFAGAKLSDSDVYVRVTGGYKITDNSADLALAKALLSAAKKSPINLVEVYIGELSLAGSILRVSHGEARLKEAARFGIVSVIGNVDALKTAASKSKIKLVNHKVLRELR